MATLHLIVLAVVQGVTEFLPISSSGHLILLPHIAGWPDQALAFDIAAHLGSLGAVTLYFREDIVALTRAWVQSLTSGVIDIQARLAWGVLIATVPVGILGLLAHDAIATDLRTPQIIAAATILFGLALWWTDARGRRTRGLKSLSLIDALFIGCAQALALIPGTSRSGVTMTAALAIGLSRQAAARFSFLLSIPVIVLAGGLEIVQLGSSTAPQPWGELSFVVLLAGLSAYVCIAVFLQFIERVGMLPFVVYRIALGCALLWYFS